MNWTLFWGIYLLAFAIVLWILTYVLFIRNINLGKHCTKHVLGRVTRYSSIQYGGMHIPLVKYRVDGKEYKKAGPKFKWGKTKTVSTPVSDPYSVVESNLHTREDLPDVLEVTVHKNSMASFTESPLLKLYPIGSSVDVYYNPKKPKVAYVQRPIDPSKPLMILMIVVSTLCTIMTLFMFIIG